MNEKKAKELRRAAGYTNQSKTPGVMPFPGIMPRGYQFPAVARRAVTRYEHVFEKGKWSLKKVEGTAIVHSGRRVRQGKFWVPDPVWLMDKDGTPKFEVMPVPKPGKLDPKQPKGIYRALKRIENRMNMEQFVNSVVNNPEAFKQYVEEQTKGES